MMRALGLSVLFVLVVAAIMYVLPDPAAKPKPAPPPEFAPLTPDGETPVPRDDAFHEACILLKTFAETNRRRPIVMTAQPTAAELIAENRIARRKLGSLPDALRPRTESDAYQIQDDASAILRRRALGAPIGYKIGCTTPAMQKYLGLDHPAAGFMYEASRQESGVQLARGDFVRPGVECEIAVTLSAPLRTGSAPFRRETVLESRGSVHPAKEIVDYP